MEKMGKLDQAKFMARGLKILENLKKQPGEQKRLLTLLVDNGFVDIATLANDLRKYI